MTASSARRSAAPHVAMPSRIYLPQPPWLVRAAYSVISGFSEAVADTIERFDHLEVVVDRLELLAQPLDVAVDRAVVDVDVLAVGGVHQLVAVLDVAGPLRANRTSVSGTPLTQGAFLLQGSGHFTIYRNGRSRQLMTNFWDSARDGAPTLE